MKTMYGYLRVAATSDAVLAAVEQRMRVFAAAGGFQLAKIYFERDAITRAAFYRMFADLQRFNVHHLLVPSVDHVADRERLRGRRLAQLADTAGVEVHMLDDLETASGETTPAVWSGSARRAR